jgi:hypothetical protein
MTKIPKAPVDDELRPESDQLGIISVNNRKVSQLAKMKTPEQSNKKKFYCHFRAITKAKSQFWRSDDVIGSITAWMS